MASTPADFTLANQLIILSAGRRPSWRAQTDTDGPPTLASDGVATGEAIVTHIKVDCREDVSHRTTYAEVDTLDLTANYTLVIDGFEVTATGPFSDLDDLLDSLVAAIEADTDADALVIATHTDDDRIKLTGRGSDDYSLDGSASGTGSWTLSGDAIGALVRVYGLAYDTTGALDDRWGTLPVSDFDVPNTGYVGPLPSAGLTQLYAEVVVADTHGDDSADLTPTTSVFLGPCPTE